MNAEIIEEINVKIASYLDQKNSNNLHEVDNKLQLLQYQIENLRYKFKIIEDVNRTRKLKEFQEYEQKFSHRNAFSVQHLVLPLLMYLFNNHKSKKPAYETSVDFMKTSNEYLHPGDFHKTKTGGIRFITNTRFAAEELRKYGLIRSDDKTYYKIWELSLFGIIVASNIYIDGLRDIDESILKNTNKVSIKNLNSNILKYYITKAKSIESIIKLFEYVDTEKDLLFNFVKVNEKKFIEFQKLVIRLFNESKNKKIRKMFFDFVHISAEDKELSNLTDLIILKKEIEINLEGYYKILNEL